MKTYHLSLFLLLLFFGACQKDRDVTEQQPEAVEQRLHLNCILEGKNQYTDTEEEVNSRQRLLPSNVVSTPCQPFKIFIEASCSDEGDINWKDLVESAVFAYNAIPSPLTMEVIDDQTEANAVIRCLPLDPCRGGFTSTISVQKIVTLNAALSPECFCPDQTTPFSFCQLQYVAMHELGHAIGLDHTDDVTAPPIPGTPYSDEMSIFNSGDVTTALCGNSCSFSEGDLAAIDYLYPCSGCTGPDPEELVLEGPEKMCDGTEAEFCAPAGFRIIWDAPAIIADSTSRCISLNTSDLSSNDGKIYARLITENNCEYPVEKFVIVLPSAPCELPPVPPIDFTSVCFGVQPVCYDFSGVSCLTGLTVTSSSPKVIVDVNGTRVCISSIFPKQENVVLTVTPFGQCQNGSTQSWNITVNDPTKCEGKQGPF